eukprot:c6582_g1_i2.p1 GENE.c6582_g1_i2~~c6582_g1_i2.p1  ORF type:complete len:140 (-),score=30.16 c6582_g1_i2:70-489(-)
MYSFFLSFSEHPCNVTTLTKSALEKHLELMSRDAQEDPPTQQEQPVQSMQVANNKSRKRKAPAFGEPAEPKPVSRKSNKKSQQRLSPPPVNSKLHQLDEQGFAERVKGPLPATSPTKDLDDAHNKTAVNSGILRWCKQP